MGGSAIDNDSEFASPSNGVRTVVLVGRTGNGKSATGNSILRRRAFKSRASSSGVTRTSELQKAALSDGQIINVIDTPGLFDFAAGPEYIAKEIVKCLNMAKDGIHAVLVVFSVKNRFSQEEEAAIRSIQNLFGRKILDYMIVVFTGGDELEDNDETLEDYLGRECPQPLKEILTLCENRRVLFDNKTKDEHKRAEQVQELLSLVNKVITHNNGQPYTYDLFAEVQRGPMMFGDQQEMFDSLKGYSSRQITELKEQMLRQYDEQLKRLSEIEMAEMKLQATTSKLEQQLAEEQAARLRAEENAQKEKAKHSEEIRQLRESLKEAHEKLRKSGSCTIL